MNFVHYIDSSVVSITCILRAQRSKERLLISPSVISLSYVDKNARARAMTVFDKKQTMHFFVEVV